MDSKSTFELVNELITSLARLLWPVFAFAVVLIFRNDISGLVRRFRRGRFFGQEMELDPVVSEFGKAVEEAQEEIPPSSAVAEKIEMHETELERDEDEVLRAAGVSPEVGLIRLSSILEREIRVLAASLGQLGPEARHSSTRLFASLVSKGYLPVHTTKSLEIFWDLRSKIIHGSFQGSDRDVLKTLDIGLALLRTVKSIPHEINTVFRSGVELYRDKECLLSITDAKGVILDTKSAGRASTYKRIFPTTRPEYYTPGKRVSWEWDLLKTWGPAWYVDPDTSERKQAWDSSGEFAGRHLDEV